MPIYEYESTLPADACPRCARRFEVVQSIHDRALTQCPQCRKPVRKCFSVPNVGASVSGFDDRAKSAGFSKLKKVSKGEYEKQY